MLLCLPFCTPLFYITAFYCFFRVSLELRAWLGQEDLLERVSQGQRSEYIEYIHCHMHCRKCRKERFIFKCLFFFLISSRVIVVFQGIEARKGSKVTSEILDNQAIQWVPWQYNVLSSYFSKMNEPKKLFGHSKCIWSNGIINFALELQD